MFKENKMKPSKARRISEELGVERLVILYRNVENPFEPTDRRHKMFIRYKAIDSYVEHLLDVLGGRPNE